MLMSLIAGCLAIKVDPCGVSHDCGRWGHCPRLCMGSCSQVHVHFLSEQFILYEVECSISGKMCMPLLVNM